MAVFDVNFFGVLVPRGEFSVKILLVDDDRIQVDALVRALTAEHFAVDAANVGCVGW